MQWTAKRIPHITWIYREIDSSTQVLLEFFLRFTPMLQSGGLFELESSVETVYGLKLLLCAPIVQTNTII